MVFARRNSGSATVCLTSLDTIASLCSVPSLDHLGLNTPVITEDTVTFELVNVYVTKVGVVRHVKRALALRAAVAMDLVIQSLENVSAINSTGVHHVNSNAVMCMTKIVVGVANV